MLKTTIIRLLLIAIPWTTFCQNADTIKTKKIFIGLTFSPDYSYRILEPDASSKWFADIRDSLEIPKLGCTTGLCLAVRINKRIAFETGLLYSDKGEKEKIGSVSGNGVSPSSTKMVFIYHYIYLDIPISVNYYILVRRAKFFITAGFSPNIFLDEKKTKIYVGSPDTRIHAPMSGSGFNRINLAMLAGLGFEYDLTSTSYLKIEPIYRRSVTSITDTPIKGYLYSVGLNAGIYFKL